MVTYLLPVLPVASPPLVFIRVCMWLWPPSQELQVTVNSVAKNMTSMTFFKTTWHVEVSGYLGYLRWAVWRHFIIITIVIIIIILFIYLFIFILKICHKFTTVALESTATPLSSETPAVFCGPKTSPDLSLVWGWILNRTLFVFMYSGNETHMMISFYLWWCSEDNNNHDPTLFHDIIKFCFVLFWWRAPSL